MSKAPTPSSSHEAPFKYWAFISYSQQDKKFAESLHHAMETYYLPAELVGRKTLVGEIPKRVFPIFLDRKELAGSANLPGEIEARLTSSLFPIVICSPASVASLWVNEEIKTFKKLGRDHRILPLILAGEPNSSARPECGLPEAFPAALRYKLGNNGKLTDERATESLAADVRQGKDGIANAKLKLLAGLLGIGYDELKRRDQLRARLRRLQNIAVTIVLIAIITAILLSAWQTNLTQQHVAQAQQLVDQGQSEFEDDPLLGVRLALEGLARLPDGNPEIRTSMVRSIRELLNWGRLSKLGDHIEELIPHPQGVVFLAKRAAGRDELRRSVDGQLITTFDRKVDRASFSPDRRGAYIEIWYEGGYNELRRSNDGSLVGRAEDVRLVQFSPDAAATYLLISYLDGPSELRRTADGEIIGEIANCVSHADFSPTGSCVAVRYHDNKIPCELLRCEDVQHLATISEGYLESIVFRPNAAATHFLMVTRRNTELRQSIDGKIIETLPHRVSKSYFSSDREASRFVASYHDYYAPGELRRTDDGALLAQLKPRVSDVSFSPDRAAAKFVIEYQDKTKELRRTSDGSLVPLTASDQFDAVTIDPNAASYVVAYRDGPAELRRMSDDKLIMTLAGNIRGTGEVSFSSDPAATYFVIRYRGARSELRRTSDGSLVAKLDTWARWAVSPGVQGDYFVVDYITGATTQLCLTGNGACVDIGGNTRQLFVSERASATSFVITYSHFSGRKQPSQLRRTSDGSLVKELKGHANAVHFSTDQDATYMVIDYEGAPAELRRTSDGAVIANLQSGVVAVDFSHDPSASYVVVEFKDGRSELWDRRGGTLPLVEIGANKKSHLFNLDDQTFVVMYADGRAFLHDLAWLVKMKEKWNAMSPEELTQLACDGPFSSKLFDASKLKPFLNNESSQACSP